MFDFSGFSIHYDGDESKFAADILSCEIKKRTDIIPQVNIDPECKFLIETDTLMDNDEYIINFDGKDITITGKGRRGLIFAIGMFLRKTRYADGKITLIEDISGHYSPSMKIRGHQLGYRTTPNTYDAWSIDDYCKYAKELMFFGVNTIEHTVFEDVPEKYNSLMKYSQNDFLRDCTAKLSELDIDISVWYPNDEKELSESVKDREKTFQNMPQINYYFPPGGDPGEYPADEFIERTIAVSNALKKIHPNAKTYPSAQTPHNSDNWGDIFIEKMNELPDEIDGVITGPNHALPLHELRKRLPEKYPIRLYPDITHNVRCEYPVHFDREDWHYAFAGTLSRECINPRPTEYRTIHRLTRQYVCGSVSYSEGVSDDVNKFVWSDMDFSPNVSLTDTLEDYARLFFFGSDEKKAVDGILGLELNWIGDPAENPHIENTLECFEQMEKENPALLENWRFLTLLFRAQCDMLVKQRRVFELKLIKSARYYLKKHDIKNANEELNRDFDMSYYTLKDSIYMLADKLFNLIGLQTDVRHYSADSWERGATLETINNPVTDREWLKNRIEYSMKLDKNEKYLFIDRLLSRNENDKDEYYFSFAENSFTELGVKQNEGFYMDFQGDRPNVNNGCIPMSMVSVYDHYSFKMKTGGLTSEKGYNLILNIKPRYNDNVDKFTIKINGHVLYSGNQYGGVRDEQFEKELSSPVFETHLYEIPDGFIENGCAEIEITEPKIGIMLSEIFIKKRD